MFVEVMKVIHLLALQFIQNNEWDAAHRLVQDYTDPLSRQIHGYLHYIEGDLDNASYWFDSLEWLCPMTHRKKH